jgi:integrase/recombinase XerC
MEQKISARSVNRKISSLKSFFKFLQRSGEVKKNPMTKVQAPKTSRRLPTFVEISGIEKLLTIIEFPNGYHGSVERMIIELLYGTGMRRSELINLKRSDFDSYNSQIKILGKGNKERLIPLHHKLRDAIRDFIGLSERNNRDFLLIDEKGRKLKEAYVYATVKKYLNLVTTVDKKSPHTLRHTFATHLMNNGADINAVKELLGHSSLAATQVYTHNTIDKLKEIYSRAHPKA